MLPTINLLHGRRDQLRKERELYAKIQFGVGIFLALYIALMVGVVAVKAYMQNQLTKVDEGIKTETLELTKLQSIEEKYILLQNKLTVLGDYLNSRGKAREFLYKIYTTLPAEVDLTSVSVGEDEKTIVIQAKARTMNAINTYLVMAKSAALQGSYRQVFVEGLSRAKDGSYSIKAEYTLAE